MFSALGSSLMIFAQENDFISVRWVKKRAGIIVQISRHNYAGIGIC